MPDPSMGMPMPARRRSGSPFESAAAVISYKQMEYFRQPLYDRVNLATGALTGDVNFFATPNGGSATLIRYQTAAAVTKTYRDTNLPSQGQDPNRDYAVYGIAIGIVPASHAAATAANIRLDKDVIKEGGSIVIKVSGNKEILRCPLLGIPELNSESSSSTTATNTTVLGGPIFQHRFYPMTTRDGRPWLLPKATILQVTMTFDGALTLSQSNDIIVWFDADIRRPL